MTILNGGRHASVIEWLPDGEGFIVKNKQKCLDEVLSVYFGISKYPSFTRRLKRWEFVHHQQGHKTASYFHPLFRKCNPGLCMEMRCHPQKKYPQSVDTGRRSTSTDTDHNETEQDGFGREPTMRKMNHGRPSSKGSGDHIHLPPTPPIVPRTTHTPPPPHAAAFYPFPNESGGRFIQPAPVLPQQNYPNNFQNAYVQTPQNYGTHFQNQTQNMPNMHIVPAPGSRPRPSPLPGPPQLSNMIVHQSNPPPQPSFPPPPQHNPHFNYQSQHQYVHQVPTGNPLQNQGYSHHMHHISNGMPHYTNIPGPAPPNMPLQAMPPPGSPGTNHYFYPNQDQQYNNHQVPTINNAEPGTFNSYQYQ